MKNINVGDKVVVVDAEDSQYSKGTVLTVIEDDGSSLPYYCRHENGTQEWMLTHEVELHSTATNQLEDRVTALESELAELKASMWAATSEVPVQDPSEFEGWATPGHLEGQAQPGKRAPQTANELRKAAIKLAQESVAESFLTDHDGGQSVMGYAGHNTVEFVVDKKNRTVVALLRFTYTARDKVRARGIAKCDPTDVFNEDIGKAIALDRALDRATDPRILRAPNPDAVVVGMVVIDTYGGLASGKVAKLAAGALGSAGYKSVDGAWSFLEDAEIVEDTDAKYE